MVLKNLWRRKTRTLLTLLGVAIGVAAVVALTAFGEGIAGGLQQLSGASTADLTVAATLLGWGITQACPTAKVQPSKWVTLRALKVLRDTDST